MASTDLGRWDPLPLQAVVATFAPAPFRWWISGGHALDLHMQRTWRPHDDTDVGIARADVRAVHTFLLNWDLHVAAAGVLTPWHGETLTKERNQNNLWCRLTATGPWVLDVTIGDGSDADWIYRRDPSLRVPWHDAVLHSVNGIPYLAPELQLLFKSAAPRPKDTVDAAEVIPRLDARQQELLRRYLGRDHPWCRLFA